MTYNPNNNHVLKTQTPKMKTQRRLCSQICLLLGGVALIGIGISIFIFSEWIYEYILKDALKFNPTSKPFNVWKTNDPPLIMEIYLFNWTNPEQIGNLSVKPEFEEVGPYRFKEIKEKVNITWHDNYTISYRHRKLYFFDEENSVRNLSDVISTINVVPLSVSFKARNFGYWTKRMISMGLSSISSLHVTKTAAEILFDGYEEPILSTLSLIPVLNVQDRFGIFYGKNATVGTDGTFSMHFKNDEKFGSLLEWNYKNRSSFYKGHCNDIRGSSGEFYPIDRKRDKLVLYSSELCKYAELEYVHDVNIKGVHGYKFTADNIFDNGTTRPENACFCVGECIPSGVFNVSACRDDSPTFLSFPHFHAADPYYRNSLRGMRPDKSKHEFYITIEPKSGIVMDIEAGMQVNMLLQPVKYINLYENVPRIYVPMFYFTQRVNLTDELASNLRLIQNLPEYFNYTVLILVGLGSICVLWGLCSCFCCSTSKDKLKISEKIQMNTHCEEVPLNEKL
ncbi:protein peste-like [Anoplophora glabripennis]|uniref:protein peste-like n=1 Tax=Anoplophora glabripennis TaxID=217634 RepID=UPI00087593E6|nr:protein peste-like [Anoplophora glabripennis]